MGKSSFFLVLALALMVGIFGAVMNKNSSSATVTCTSYYSRIQARNAANSAMQLGMRQLASNSGWRTGYQNISIGGNNVSLAVAKVGDSIQVVAKSPYYSDSVRSDYILTRHLDTLTT